MSKITRREALRLGLFGAASGGISCLFAHQAPALARAAGLGGVRPDNKLLLVFLRGGNDGLNTLIPNGIDASLLPFPTPPGYQSVKQLYDAARPNLKLSLAQSISLTNFASMHPALQPLQAAYNAGDLALMHRIGYANSSKSHFSAQKFWESAEPGNEAATEGFVPRLVQFGTLGTAGSFAGASMSDAMQLLFNTVDVNRILAHIPRIESNAAAGQGAYSLYANKFAPTFKEQKLRGSIRSSNGHPGLSGDFDALARANGDVMISSQDSVSPLAASGTGYPTSAFGSHMRDAVTILKLTNCIVAGVELGAFDTHNLQVPDDGSPPTTGLHATQLDDLAKALSAVYNDTIGSSSVNLLTLVFSEFGRRVGQNGSHGTEHGEAGVMLALGGRVKGNNQSPQNGVFNCDAGNWAGTGGPLDPGSLPFGQHSLPFATDFRAVFEEAFTRHFNITGITTMDSIMPGYQAAKQAGGAEFNFLNYL